MTETYSDKELEFHIGYTRIRAKDYDSVEADTSYPHSGHVGNAVAKFRPYPFPVIERSRIREVA